VTATVKNENASWRWHWGGRMQTYPVQLTLTLAHPTRQGMDQILTLDHIGGSAAAIARRCPSSPPCKWQIQLADHEATWRLGGVLHTPLDGASHWRLPDPSFINQGRLKWTSYSICCYHPIGLLSLFTILFIIGMAILPAELVQAQDEQPGRMTGRHEEHAMPSA